MVRTVRISTVGECHYNRDPMCFYGMFAKGMTDGAGRPIDVPLTEVNEPVKASMVDLRKRVHLYCRSGYLNVGLYGDYSTTGNKRFWYGRLHMLFIVEVFKVNNLNMIFLRERH
jgi:hypothetical protein